MLRRMRLEERGALLAIRVLLSAEVLVDWHSFASGIERSVACSAVRHHPCPALEIASSLFQTGLARLLGRNS
jgi:hypothetical protein